MSSTTDPAASARRRWRLICLAVSLLGLVVLLASALPWFTETRLYSDDSTTSKAINIWADGPGVANRSRSGTLATFAGSGQWGMFVMAAAGVGALCGLFARGRHPGDPNLSRALLVNLGGAVLAPIFAVLALVGANGGERVSATPHVGFLITVPALLGWVVCAVLMWRAGRTATATGQRSW